MLSVGDDKKIFLNCRAVLHRQSTRFAVDINHLRSQPDFCRFAWKIWICRKFFQGIVDIYTMVEIPPRSELFLDVMKQERLPHLLEGITLWPADLLQQAYISDSRSEIQDL